MRRPTSIVAAAALGALFAQTPARGGVPRVMSFQGRLSHADGGAVADGDYSVAFRIYGQETGGAPLWEETQTVSVADGLCSVLLGVVTPLSPAFDAQYWLAVEVESDGEMTPRFRLAAAPYALRAEDADSVGGLSAGELLDKATYDSDGDGKVDSAAHAAAATDADSVGGLQAGELLDKATYDSDGDGKADSAEAAGDADTVDGKHAAELADAVHDHDAAYLNVTGDAMTGALTLASDPSNPLDAATKQFVESVAGSGVSSLGAGTGIVLTPDPITDTGTIAAKIGTSAGTVAAGEHTHTTYVAKAGDTMSGDLSLGGNQITNVRVDVLTDAPEAASAANEGRVYYNLTLKRLEYSNGTEWVPVGPGRTIRATATPDTAANAAARVTNEVGPEYRVATAFEALALLSVNGTTSVGAGDYWVEGAGTMGGANSRWLFWPDLINACPQTANPDDRWVVRVGTDGRLLLLARPGTDSLRVLAIDKE